MHLPRPIRFSYPESVEGRCRVVCFSSRHDVHLGGMVAESVRAVVDAWADETERLVRDEHVAYVQVFENRGALMGASNPHPHGQIWAVGAVPTVPAKKAVRQELYRESHPRDLLGDYIEEEMRRDERIVDASEHWLQLVPFWAVWPYETMLVPRRQVPCLDALEPGERDDLARLVRRATRRYDTLFSVSFPYSMGWYQIPRDGDPYSGSRLHAVYLPPLLSSASVRKFLVGFELTAEPQRDFSPEEAARKLRSLDVSG